MFSHVSEVGKALLAVALLVSLLPAAALQPRLADAACDTAANPIVCENALAGTNPSVWDIPSGDAGDPSIQGFATDISVNKGQTARFKINTPATAYNIDIYRMGYYGGLGARLQGTATPSAALPQTQPACLTNPSVGLVDCGNWAESAAWNVPATAVTGIYFAKLTRPDTGGTSHIYFVVRDDASTSPLLFQTSDETWQAYNSFGGASLYRDFNNTTGAGRAFKVSYNRPFNTRTSIDGLGPRSFVWSAEYPMVRFLEANGLNVAYMSGVDTERRGVPYLQQHKAFLSVGHDEYWSGAQRTVVEQARDAGVHLAFFSGNQMFWKTRWENSTEGSNTPYRTLVTYKETHANAKIDPLPNVWTGTFRDPRFSPPADGGKPENAVAGQLFTVNGPVFAPMTVPAAMGKLRLWRNTPLPNLAPNTVQTITAGCNCILGHEWDEDLDNGFRPAGLIHMSATTSNVPFYIQDFGSVYSPGTATHNLTLYRAASGALVFGAGTVNWSWALDATHDEQANGNDSTADPIVQQATINILADMGAVAGSIRPGLVASTASTDTTKPTSVVTAPASGANVPNGTPVTITGTASDAGGQVGGMEISIDGGATWKSIQGTTAWTYTFTPGIPGVAINIKTRAIDDSGNIETPGAGIVLNVTQRSCGTAPCSIWSESVAPIVKSNPDNQSIEIGTKFRTDQAGYIKGAKFYKGPANTGTHIGSLWTMTGTKLGSVTFANETPTGWQTANFPTPIPVSAGQTYIISYHAPVGGYSADQTYFALNGVDNAPLHALRNGVDGGQGVFAYSQNPFFPGDTFNSTNYWVDVVFTTDATDTTAPSVSSRSPSPDSTNAPTNAVIKATFNENVVGTSVNFVLRENGTNAIVSTTFGYDANTTTATLTPQGPLQMGTTYTASVLAALDTQGNAMGSPSVWQFSTPACPCSLWGTADEPTDINADRGDTSDFELGLRWRSQLNGVATAVRFFKGNAANGGAHVGHLWNTAGQLLGTATFGSETASGWQTATFTSPITITANTDYIVSYRAPQGHYAGHVGALASQDREVGPLIAPHSATGAPNGVFGPGGTFPTSTFQGTNYFVDIVFDTGAPNAPAITVPPTATDLTETTATIKWTTETASDSMVEYGIHPATGGPVYGSYSVVNPAQVTAHSIALTALLPGQKYDYRVISRTSAGGRVVSGNFTFDTVAVADTTPPGFIAGSIKATAIDSQSEKITWDTDENSTTQVEYGTSTSYGSSTDVTDQNSPTKTHTVTLSNLAPSTTYHYRVKSADAAGNLATSADFTFVTNDVKIASVAAQVPAGEPGETSATISWTTDANADSQVEYGLTNSYGSSTPVNDDEVTTHSVVVSGLTPNTTYHYRVKSTATPGHTSISGDFTFKTNAPRITNVIETALDGRTERIQWTTATPMDSQIEYGTSPTFGSQTTLDPAMVTSHSVTITGLLPGTTYYYRLLSKDAAGILASLTDTFTTPADGTPPSFVTGSIKAQSITINSASIVWVTNEASDSQVEYGPTTAYGSSTPLNTARVTIHTAALTGLQPNTTYNFRVKSRDATGNLAVSGNFTFKTLVAPRSIDFNGSTAYAEAPHASEVNVGGDWTIEAWFKDESTNGYFHLPTTIISKGDLVQDAEVPFAIGITYNALYLTEKQGGQIAYMYYDLAGHRVSANSWHHVAVTMKSFTRQATIYLDGVQVMQGTLSRNSTVGNSKPVSIGRNGAPTSQALWNGKLDDVRIWNVVRTSAQISANYRSQLNGAQTGLVANWKFDEGSGTTALDSTSVPENATLNGGAAYSSDVHN